MCIIHCLRKKEIDRHFVIRKAQSPVEIDLFN